MSAIKLVQISDCHLPESRATGYRGKYVWERLELIVEKIKTWQPDLVVATGDISEQAGSSSYQFFQQCLGQLKVPVYCLNGNHDIRAVMQEQFKPPVSVPTTVAVGNWRLHFLDSASHERIEGELSNQQLSQLATAIDEQEEDWAILFLHHQPFLCGSHWIDRYPLKQPEALIELVDKRPQIRSVCWGHIHHSWQQKRQHCLWQACPSTAFTVLPQQERPIEDPRGPACRWLELKTIGKLKTGIFYPAEG